MRIRLRTVLMPLIAALSLTAALALPATAAINPTQNCLNRCSESWARCMVYECSTDACAHVCDYRYEQCSYTCFMWA